jgi:rsbT co-antagonist protein RsbR
MLPELVQLEASLVHSAVPVWVIVGETIKFVWANDLALELWHAPDRAELFARDMIAGAPEKVLARTRHVVEQVRTGKIVREEYVFYPRGKPTPVVLDLRGVLLADGSLGVLNQALPLSETPDAVRRAMTMARHTTIMAALVRADGSILTKNPAALLAFDEHDSWIAWLADANLAPEILRAALAGETVRVLAQVSARGSLRWHMIDAHALRDPVSGELGVLVEHIDETARIDAEQLAAARGQRIDDLSATVELIERQRREILALSAPLLDVGHRTLAVPIIGRLDDEQSNALMSKLLDAVRDRGARHVILDVTGVAEIDQGSALRLQRLLSALRLLGAASTITGVRPALALELTQSGVDLEGVTTLRSLAAGLQHAHAPNQSNPRGNTS